MPFSIRLRIWSAALFCTLAAFLPACTPIDLNSLDVETNPLARSLTLLQIQANSPDASVRANCIEALQPSTDPTATAVIEQGLHDREWVVRFAAAMAIGKRQNAQYKPILADLVAKDPNDSVRAAAVYALRRLGDTSNMNILVALLQSPDPSVRANVAFILGLMGDRSAIPLLESCRSESDQRVKFEIVAALARLGSRTGQHVITALALSRFAEDQWTAMTVCADLPLDIAANPLLLGLKDPPPQTPADVRSLTTRRQLIAARSLAKLGSSQGHDVAMANLRNQEPDIRALAALALGDMLTPDDATPVAKLLRDPEPMVQRAAAAAVVNIWARQNHKP